MLTIKDRTGIYSEQIRSFLVSNFYVSDVKTLMNDTSLLDQGIVDSTGVLEIIGFIEETFGIIVEDSEPPILRELYVNLDHSGSRTIGQTDGVNRVFDWQRWILRVRPDAVMSYRNRAHV